MNSRFVSKSPLDFLKSGGARRVNSARLLKTLACLLVAAIGLWTSVSWAERLSRPDSMTFPLPVTLYIPDENGQIPDGASPIIPEHSSDPAYFAYDPTRTRGGIFRHEFKWNEEDGDIALFLSWTRRIKKVELNGRPISLDLRTSGWATLNGFQPGAFPLDRDALRAGINTIDIVDTGRSKKVLPAFSIVPINEAYQAAFWGRFFYVDLVITALGIMFFVLVFCLAIRWPETDRRLIYPLLILIAAWSVRCMGALGLTDHIPSAVSLLFDYWVSYTLIFAFALYAGIASRAPRLLMRVYLGIYLATLLSTGLMAPYGGQAIFELAYPLESILVISLGVIVVGQLLHLHYRSDEQRFLATVLFLIAIGAIILDALDDRFLLWTGFTEMFPYTYYAAPRYGLLIALALLTTLIQDQTRARYLAVNMNTELQERLQKKEAELQTVYDEREEDEKRNARAAERERIMMDMHDGLGARLVGLDALAQSPQFDKDDFRREVGESLRELRFIADSLNAMDSDWSVVFASLRHRVGAQLGAAGIELDWTIDPKLASLHPEAETATNVSRLIGEAFTNIIRHSEAESASLSAAISNDCIVIEISDDGKGISASSSNGVGLSSMRRRAKNISGTLDISTAEDQSGTQLRLSFPHA